MTQSSRPYIYRAQMILSYENRVVLSRGILEAQCGLLKPSQFRLMIRGIVSATLKCLFMPILVHEL
jgi:hypothetical protein